MHYKNGRPAVNGDKVMYVPDPKYGGVPQAGILYNATAGNDYCNGKIAHISSGDICPNLKEVLHYDDFMSALPDEVKNPAK